MSRNYVKKQRRARRVDGIPAYRRNRLIVIYLAGGRCELCGTSPGWGALTVHHLEQFVSTDTHNRADNLTPLCRACHDRVDDYGQKRASLRREDLPFWAPRRPLTREESVDMVVRWQGLGRRVPAGLRQFIPGNVRRGQGRSR